MFRTVSFLLISLAVVAGVVAMRQGESDTASAQPMRRIHPVETIAVQLQDGYQYSHDYLGEVVARRSSELGFELAGRIMAMDVSEGDVFEAGAVLAELDTDRLVEQRIELTARADQIDAKLQELIVGPRPETIAAAEATVKDLNHQLELAQRNRKRRQQLVDRQMAAREDLDAAQFGAQSIAAKLDVTQHQLDELRAGTRDEVIQAQKAAFAQAKSLLAQNQIEIDRSVIRAPYDCTVTRRMADVGQVVAAGTQILSVVANREPEVWIGVPIDQSKSLKKDCQTDVLINGQTHQGVCKNIVPQLDQATRTMTVIVSLGGATIDQVPIGQTARLSLQRNATERGCWLPVGALLKSTRGLWSCFRLVEEQPEFDFDETIDGPTGRLERCDVEILHSDGDRVFVRSPLDDGDLIVRSGSNRVAPNQWAYAVESTQMALK
jgi:multidrug efflux pump subunit AcrA (membrane-fusion protein)